MRNFTCVGCGNDNPLGIMIQDELWASIATNKRDILCPDCIESRLGRPLHPEDLKPGWWTDVMKLGHKILSRI